jgi:hypothetical protein
VIFTPCPVCGATEYYEDGVLYRLAEGAVCPGCSRRTHPSDPGEPQHGIPRIGIAHDEESILRLLSFGKRVLEIGTGLGYSTRALIDGGALTLHTVDVDPWVGREIVPVIRDHWWHVNANKPGSEFCFFDDPAKIEHGYDLAFIDGDHSFAAARVDTVRSINAVRHGGLILFHDWVHTGDTVRRGVESVVGAGYCHYLPTTYGIGLLAVDAECKRKASETGLP